MPKPTEICIVKADGVTYTNWKTVEVSRAITDPETGKHGILLHCMLTVAETNKSATSITNLKLRPGDQVEVQLAGQLALQGMVYLRQAAVDAYQHGVQIGIVSLTQNVIASTVDCQPGQYINQTVQQIISGVFGKVGVKFTIVGSPSGADLPFDRVSEHMGESRFEFCKRLCYMRNLHLIDSLEGMIAFRGSQQSTGLSIIEGINLQRGRVLLQTWDYVDPIYIMGQDKNKDSADENRGTQGTANVEAPSLKLRRPLKLAAPESGPNAAMQMAAQQEADYINLSMVDGDITVPGWLTSDGTLWIEHVREVITLKAPTLLPEDEMEFMIKGVVHRQSNEGGTTTDILLCDKFGFFSGASSEPVFLKSDSGTSP